MISETVLRQFVLEAESWSRWVQFCQNENSFLKARLAEAVNNSNNPEALRFAESFQEQFLAQDAVLDFLEGECYRQQLALSEDPDRINGGLSLAQQQKILRKDIEQAGSLFRQVKNDFEAYISDGWMDRI